MNNWQAMFEKRPEETTRERDAPSAAPEEADIAPPPDPREYKPWLLQRGARPAMFLDLRRFDPRTQTLIGCQVSYPYLYAIDYVGDHMVSLDFGSRIFVIEGRLLGELAARLQSGMVLAIHEYSATIWPCKPNGPVVTRIVRVGERSAQSPRGE